MTLTLFCVYLRVLCMCVPGKRAAVAESCRNTGLQPAEAAARPTEETQDVPGEGDARTRSFSALFTQTRTFQLGLDFKYTLVKHQLWLLNHIWQFD